MNDDWMGHDFDTHPRTGRYVCALCLVPHADWLHKLTACPATV